MAPAAEMRALVMRHAGRSATISNSVMTDLAQLLALRRIAVPSPGPRQVLVKVSLSPVNPSDLLYVKGEYGLPRTSGIPPGFEGVGIVIAGGDPQAAALTGRRVSFLASGSGAWAEYALTDTASCVCIADELCDEDAAGLLINPLTALAMIDLVVDAGASALVLTAAASQLGRMVIQLACDRGVAPIAVLRSPAEEATLRALGAAEVLVSNAPEFAEKLHETVSAAKPRILLDAVGDQVSADIFLAMPAHSRWISYGVLSAAGPRLPDMRQFVFSDKRIEGFWLSRWLRTAALGARAHAVAEAQRRALTGDWRTRVAARVPLEDALGTLPASLGRSGKTMLAPGASFRPS